MKRIAAVALAVSLAQTPALLTPGAEAAAPPGAAPSRVTSGTTTTLSRLEFETRLRRKINHHRVAIGCRAERLRGTLRLAARRHSRRMARAQTLSHQLPGEQSLGPRVTAAGYSDWHLLAENLADGGAWPGQVFRMWMASPAHRANIDDCRYHDIGIGVVIRNGTPWTTADFGRKW